MYHEDNGTGLRDITTVVQCPDCFCKFSVKLGIDFLVKHQGEQLKVVCMECSQKRIDRIK